MTALKTNKKVPPIKNGQTGTNVECCDMWEPLKLAAQLGESRPLE